MALTRILNHQDIAAVVTHVGADAFMRELIGELKKAFTDWCDTEIDVPARTGFHYQQPSPGLVEWMPLHQKREAVFQKAVGYHPRNPAEQNLPTVVSSFFQFDPANGQLQTIADGGLLTAMRTGAASAVATAALADLADGIQLGLIGCGAQAVTQLHAIQQVATISRVLIFDADGVAQQSFADRVQAINDLNVPIVAASCQTIVKEADVICTATSVEVGAGPVFEDADAKPRLHVNAIGSDFPGKTELPKTLLQRSLVVPDFPVQAALEGECQQLAETERGPSIMEMLRNAEQLPYARRRMTVFDSTGWALEDYIALKVLLKHAAEVAVGQHVDVSSDNGHPLNPYAAVSNPVLAGVE